MAQNEVSILWRLFDAGIPLSHGSGVWIDVESGESTLCGPGAEPLAGPKSWLDEDLSAFLSRILAALDATLVGKPYVHDVAYADSPFVVEFVPAERMRMTLLVRPRREPLPRKFRPISLDGLSLILAMFRFLSEVRELGVQSDPDLRKLFPFFTKWYLAMRSRWIRHFIEKNEIPGRQCFVDLIQHYTPDGVGSASVWMTTLTHQFDNRQPLPWEQSHKGNLPETATCVVDRIEPSAARKALADLTDEMQALGFTVVSVELTEG